MADKKKVPEQARVGPFRLGRKFDEVGPDVGHLYESWHEATGRPALTLRPGEQVYWLHKGPWRLGLSCEEDSPDVSLTVEQAPPFAPPTQVADLLVLMDAAFRCVEDSPRLLSHFASGPRKVPGARRTPLAALVGASVLALALGVWFHVTAGIPPNEKPQPGGDVLLKAPSLVNSSSQGVAYPLPKQPFRNQAKAPCKTQLSEVEINGGCWVELAQKPPCAAIRAEHEGKCYLPVSKERDEPPSSAIP